MAKTKYRTLAEYLTDNFYDLLAESASGYIAQHKLDFDGRIQVDGVASKCSRTAHPYARRYDQAEIRANKGRGDIKWRNQSR